MREYKPRPQRDAACGGYVYVIAHDSGLVKVGRTQNVTSRFDSHEQAARSFGLKVTDRWASPLHGGWLENEQELMRIARELGGTPTTPEYFNGVEFGALAARACELPFPPPVEGEAAPRLNGTPEWLKGELAVSCRRISCGWYDAGETLRLITEQALNDRDFVRLLVERYVRKSLKAGLLREMEQVAKAA